MILDLIDFNYLSKGEVEPLIFSLGSSPSLSNPGLDFGSVILTLPCSPSEQGSPLDLGSVILTPALPCTVPQPRLWILDLGSTDSQPTRRASFWNLDSGFSRNQISSDLT